MVGNAKWLNPTGMANNLGEFSAHVVSDITNGYGLRSGDFTPEMAKRAEASIIPEKFGLASVFKSAANSQINSRIGNLGMAGQMGASAVQGAAMGTKSELDLIEGHKNNIENMAAKKVPGYVHENVTLPNGKTGEIWVDASAVPGSPGADPVMYSTDPKLMKGKTGDAYQNYAASEALKYTEKLKPEFIEHTTLDSYLGENEKPEDVSPEDMADYQDKIKTHNENADKTNEANEDPDVIREYSAGQYSKMIDRVMKGGKVDPNEPNALPTPTVVQNSGSAFEQPNATSVVQANIAAPAPAV